MGSKYFKLNNGKLYSLNVRCVFMEYFDIIEDVGQYRSLFYKHNNRRKVGVS